MSLRYFAISTLLLAAIALIGEAFSVVMTPDIGTSIQRSKQRGDLELRNFDLKSWTRMALVGNTIASSLAVAFLISGLGLLRRRRWARILFVAASLGVVAFMVASCVHYFDATGLLHVGYGLALLALGWWFLFRSQASALFVLPN
jgi:hypothetical protein